MSYYVKVAKYIDKNPQIVYNLKQFRALLLDLTENDIPLTNLLITATIDELHIRVSKLKKEQRKEIVNLIHSFIIRYAIDPKYEDTLYEFYANVFAERMIPEKTILAEEKLDPIINLNLKSIADKKAPTPLKLYTPCGVNKKDLGFYIKGIKESNISNNKYANLYSIVLGILQRSIISNKSKNVIQFENEINHEINYANVFRLEIILLLLIKNNYDINNEITISYNDSIDDLNCALNEINYLTQIIAELCKINFSKLQINIKNDGTKISTHENTGDVYFINETNRKTLTRIQWEENSVIYRIDKTNESNLQILLQELFLYNDFLPGQKECLIRILNNISKSSITILPVGGGKSLIFYFLAYLKSTPTFIVTPSMLLIADQIRNLRMFHDIDDSVQLTYDMDFKNYYPANKLIYITPKAFLNRELLCRIIKLNYANRIGHIILDEVHCISNWGHDFKPEYLMLSYNLNEFLSNASYICFTGTANYKVINDIKEQLNIDINNVHCPIALKSTSFNFNFNKFLDENSLIESSVKMISYIANNDELYHSLIFTKTQKEAATIYEMLDNNSKTNVDLASQNYSSYHDFIRGNTSSLICGELFGIGINLPRINNIIHIGAPLSKSQYVQEIGRAARNKNTSTTSILYLDTSYFQGLNSKIIDKSIPINKLIEMFNNESFSEEGQAIIKKLFGNIENRSTFKDNVIDLMHTIEKLQNDGRISFKIDPHKDFDNEVSKITRYLYILFRVGYIFGWYYDRFDKVNGLITYYIDPGKDKATIESIKLSTIEYINRMGEYKNTITNIKHSRKIENIVSELIDWYYTQLLYYHREQYLDMLDFLNNYQGKSNKLISSEINHYFSLSLLKIQKNSDSIKSLSIQEIYSLALNKSNKSIVENIKHMLENEYSNRLDLCILLNNYAIYNIIDTSRLIRILDNSEYNDREEILKNLSSIYDSLENEIKMNIINIFIKYFDLNKIINTLYDNSNKDVVYYYMLSTIANEYFGR